jgi:hypothetical protein
MKDNFILIVLLIILCNTSCSPQSETAQIIETDNKVITFNETIHINNCGGKGDSEQIAERSFATNVEGNIQLKGGANFGMEAEAAISAKYGQYRGYSKSQKLIAPPHTNMQFELMWTEQTIWGTIISGEQSQTYAIHAPILVEQLSSADLGCEDVVPMPVSPNNINVDVSGKLGWQSTGLIVQKGQHVSVNATGQWAGRVGWGPSLPDIWADANGVNFTIYYPEFGITDSFGRLMGRIGNRAAIPLGTNADFISESTGEFSLCMFDVDMSDNAGSISVEIVVEP